jgi:hypothetical protein
MEHHLGSFRRRRRTELPEYVTGEATSVTGGVTMLPLSRHSKSGGHVQSGRLLRGGPKQAILHAIQPNAAAPRAFDRQMELTSRDPFATL